MIDKNLKDKFHELHHTYERAGETMKDLLGQQMEGEDVDQEEFAAIAARRMTSKDSLEGLIKFATKEERLVINEFH
jgi:hypothetical protein